MDQKTIQAGNRLIALYMGAKVGNPVGKTEVLVNVKNWYGKTDTVATKDLQYHRQWNYLMDVIQNISLIPFDKAEGYHDTCHPVTFNMPAENGQFMFRFKGFSLHQADTLIEAAWLAVVEVMGSENNY